MSHEETSMDDEHKYRLLPIARGENKEAFVAKISSHDYDRVLQENYSWRLSESGYAVAVRRQNGKLITEYLHKFIMGKSCRHINGDRLDNRRSNLRPIPIETTVPPDEIFTLRRPFDDDDIQDDYVSDEFVSTCKHITYGDDTTYTGRVKMGKPHGFGVSIIRHEKQLIGYWEEGIFKDGIVVHLLPSQIVSPQILIVCPQPTMGIEIVQGGIVQCHVGGP